MLKLKKQLNLHSLKIILFICLGLLFVINSNQIMAMDDYNLNIKISINNKNYQLSLKKENLSNKNLYSDKLNLSTFNLKQQLKILDQMIQNIYKKLIDANVLKYINEQIKHYLYEQNK
ncbi:MAG: SVM family protein [Vigna little leaf phytoplasma]|nr:SVM family protein [Vigna little leaf phytoplasma]